MNIPIYLTYRLIDKKTDDTSIGKFQGDHDLGPHYTEFSVKLPKTVGKTDGGGYFANLARLDFHHQKKIALVTSL